MGPITAEKSLQRVDWALIQKLEKCAYINFTIAPDQDCYVHHTFLNMSTAIILYFCNQCMLDVWMTDTLVSLVHKSLDQEGLQLRSCTKGTTLEKSYSHLNLI